MRARKFGRIVNITSAMVKSPRAHQGLSTAARTALTALSKAISIETVVDNVTINNVLPERIDSPRQQFLIEREAKMNNISIDAARAKLTDTIAAKRFGRPEEFARHGHIPLQRTGIVHLRAEHPVGRRGRYRGVV